MKKIFALTLIIFLVTTFVSAQTAATEAAKNAVQANQAVNAADVQNSENKNMENCSSASKSCCMRKAENSSASAGSSKGESCKSVSFGMSAEKPKEESTKNINPK